MATQLLTEVKIEGIDIESNLKEWKIKETFGDEVQTCEISISNGVYDLIPTLRPGHSITIKRGVSSPTEQFVFDGTIDRINKEGAKITIFGKDALAQLINANVNYSYDGVAFPSTESKISDIAEDLIETFGGMTATVVDTGTSLILRKFICRDTDVFSRLQVLANIVDYQIFYDADDQTVHFEPKGYTSSASTLYVSGPNKNVKNIPKWDFDNAECMNSITVRGAFQEVQDEEFFNGTGAASQVFTLAKIPITVQVFEGSVLKVPGVENSTQGSYDYTIDKETKKISCTASWAPASGTNNVKIIYTNAIPVSIQLEDAVSQGKYGTISGTKFFSDIQTVTDAESRGRDWLSKYSEPFVKTMVQPIDSIDRDAGHSIRIIDLLNNEDRVLVINQIVKQYPSSGDELYLGDKQLKIQQWGVFTLERIRRLEEENERSSDLLIQVKDFTHSVNFKNRYMKVIMIDRSSTSIYDRADAIYDTSVYEPDVDDDPEVIMRIIWYDQTVIEKFKDTDFYDVSNTTATWDTSGQQLVFV